MHCDGLQEEPRRKRMRKGLQQSLGGTRYPVREKIICGLSSRDPQEFRAFAGAEGFIHAQKKPCRVAHGNHGPIAERVCARKASLCKYVPAQTYAVNPPDGEVDLNDGIWANARFGSGKGECGCCGCHETLFSGNC